MSYFKKAAKDILNSLAYPQNETFVVMIEQRLKNAVLDSMHDSHIREEAWKSVEFPGVDNQQVS